MKRLALSTFFLAMLLLMASQAFAGTGHHSHNHAQDVKASSIFDSSDDKNPHCPLKHNINTPEDCPHSTGHLRNPGFFLVADCHGGSSEGPLNSQPQLKNLTAGTLDTMESPFHTAIRFQISTQVMTSQFENVPTPPPPSA